VTLPLVPHSLKLWVNADEAVESTPLIVSVFNGFVGTIYKHQVGPGWQPVEFAPFLPLDANTILFLALNNDTVGADTTPMYGRWVVDDIQISPVAVGGEDMAVMLSAFGVRAALARAQAALNAEIAFVETEANIGLDLPLVTGWRAYDAGVATPDVTEFEIFERGPLTFPHEAYDQSRWFTGQRTIVTSRLPMRAAINHANRGNANAASASLLASQMAERTRFYGAALARCYRNDPTCGQGVGKLVIVPLSVTYNVRDVARIGDNLRSAARVEFDFNMELAEQPNGETVLGGASLPSVTTQESP
jgi:hypothetical protein